MTPPHRSIPVCALLFGALFIAGTASAQQLTFAPARSTPTPVEVGVSSENLTEPSESRYAVAKRANLACHEEARSFRVRNSASPSERKRALDACTAAVREPQIAKK